MALLMVTKQHKLIKNQFQFKYKSIQITPANGSLNNIQF